VEPTLIAERIWPGRPVTVEELGGGITNRNFKITLDSESYVLRLGGKDTELLGIDRDIEHGASRAAAAAGIGPEVVAFVEPEGWLVTRFVEGRPAPPEELATPEGLAEVVAGLKRFHDGPPIAGVFDSFRVVEGYRDTAAARDVTIPDAYAQAKEVADRIEQARAGEAPCPCHNDLLNANFIRGDGRLWIVDWEYAGMGDRFFDLANFAANHELDAAGKEELLRAYFGDLRAEDAAALELMRFMSDFREAMWGVVQQGISELDFDFVAYATEHFDRLLRTADEPSFRAALEASA
jgi:thiamine kinase-like enzyme